MFAVRLQNSACLRVVAALICIRTAMAGRGRTPSLVLFKGAHWCSKIVEPYLSFNAGSILPISLQPPSTIVANAMTKQSQLKQAIYKNAERLVFDASLLHKHRRWASSIALSVLAIEEMGKLRMVANLNATAAEQRRHRNKQVAIGAYYVADTSQEAILSFLKSHDFEIRHNDELSDWQRAYLDSEQGQQQLSMLRTKLVSHLESELHNHPDEQFLDQALGGAIDALKQSALYVDSDSDGNINDPAAFTEDQSTEFLERARRAVELGSAFLTGNAHKFA